MQARRRPLWSGFPARRSLTAALCLAGAVAHPALAADAANEARAINQQVNALIKAANFTDAEALAKKGLPLCDNVGNVKVFCASQFNESLGDIAYAQKRYSEALEYQQQSLHLRETGLDSGNVLISRSLLRVGMAYLALQRAEEAEAALKRAISGFEQQTPPTRELAAALGYLRKDYADTGRIDMAIATGRRQLAAYEAIGDKDGKAVASARINLATALAHQAQDFLDKQNFPEAEQALIEALKIVDPPAPGNENLFAVLQAQYGSLYEKQRRYAEAEPYMLRALEYRSKIAGPGDSEMPTLLYNLASLYSNLDRPSDTVTYAVRAIAWFDENKQEKPNLGFDLMHLARAQRKLGHLADSEAAFLRARDVLDRLLPETDPVRVNARIETGSLWIDQERYGEAEQLLQSALDMEQKLPRPATGWRSSILVPLALAYREQARYPEAERFASEAVKLDEAAGNERVTSLGQGLTELASIYRRENRYADAEAALLRALALQQPELDRAAAQNALGVVYQSTGQYEKAATVLKEALAIRTRMLPANSFWTAETIGNIATVDNSIGRYGDAEAELRHVLEIVESSGPSNSSNAALYSTFLAYTLVTQGKLDEAANLIARALDIYRQRLGTEHPRYGGALKTLASIEVLRGRDRNAEDHYRQALAIDEKVIGPQSPAVAGDLLDLVPILKRAGNRQDARADIDRAIAIDTAAFGADSTLTAAAVMASAHMAYEEGKYQDARQLADQVRQIQERDFGSDHFSLATGRIFMSQLDIAQGRLDDADRDIARAAEIVAQALPADSPANIEVLQAKVVVARARGKLADAEQYASDALGLAEKLYQPDHPVRRNAIDQLTGALWVQGKFADAERLQRDELGKVELQSGPDNPTTATALRGVAGILGNSGRQSEAVALFRRALAIDEQSFGPQSDQAAWDHLVLGSLLRRMGQFEDALGETNRARHAWESQGHVLAARSALEELAAIAFDRLSPAEGIVFVEQAVDVTEHAFGSDSPGLAAVLAQLGRFYAIVGRNDEAEKILARINRLIGDDPPEQAPGYLGVLQLRAQLSAQRGNFDEAEAGLMRVLAVAAKYGGPQGEAIGNNSANLAVVYLRANRFQDAIKYFAKALGIFKRENGDHAPIVGYTLLGAGQAYDKIGDAATSKALFAAALEILGPAIAAQRPQPKWL